MTTENGPYVQAACFCEMVLEDKTGALSLIRIIDVLTHTSAGPNPPEEMQPFAHELTLVVMLKSGAARGRHELSIVPELPSGETRDPIVLTVHFEGEERGHNVVARLVYTFTLEGLYWFGVFLDGEKISAIPLRIKYNRLLTGTSQ
ncbi:MAG: hypothetical protein QME94_02965 [Anaerolineae bacterium]|nr:hypothetical protein [Anaerolineae bacterium]